MATTWFLSLAGAVLAAPAPKILLVASSPENYTARALAALQIAHDRVAPNDYSQRSPFDYDLVIWGMDESRSPLGADPETIQAFVRAGGVFLGFRSNEEDPWLPTPLSRDKAYALGEVLQPNHPIFTTPHRFSREALLQVHGGSIYRAFFNLGEGWIPLLSTGAEQAWDTTPARDTGPHFGMVERSFGKGRILLVQMIPEYHWFHDSNGDRTSAGAKLFENVLRYVMNRAPRTAALRPPRHIPQGFHADLAEVLAVPKRREGIPLDDPAWRFTSQGPYKMKVDRRGVLTFTHDDVPSVAGHFAQVSRSLPVPKDAGTLALRWYESDTYCGGREIILGGARHGQTALENLKRGFRYAQVLVNGQTVWEEDVLGRNPQPARTRVRMANITNLVKQAGGQCEVTLRVEDRKGSGEEPFAIDVFFAAVEVIPGLQRGPAAKVLSGPAFQTGEGESLVLRGQKGFAEFRHQGPAGRYAIAVRLRDEHTGQSRLRVVIGGKVANEWKLSADDHRLYWAVTGVVPLAPGVPIRIEGERHGEESVSLYEVAVIPEAFLAPPAPSATPPAAGGEGARRVRFSVNIHETAGIRRTDEVAAQGLPFPARCLTHPSQIRVLASDGRAVPVQTRPIARWPDGSIKILHTAFPVSVAEGSMATYTVEAGEGVNPTPVSGGLTLREAAGLLVIDTGVITATVSTRWGRLVEEVRRGTQVIKPAGEVWDLLIEEENGRILRTREAAVAETQIVERGPLRALIVRKGSFTDANGTLLDFRLHLEATAGSDALRLEAFLIHREETPEVYLKRWTMALARAGADSSKVWLTPQEVRSANAGAVLYQHREDTLTWTGADGSISRGKAKAPGRIRLPGMAVGLRWFWQRYPQAIRFGTNEVAFDFIPQAFDEADLPTRWLQRMRETTDRYTVGGVGYPQSPGKMGLFRVAQGEALSQEILFVMDGRDVNATDVSVFAALDAPLRAVPDPQYTASTLAFGEFHPADPKRYPRYEESVERAYQGVLAQREKRREYGFENFGDTTFEWGYGPSYTYWSNSEYDHHHGFAQQYLRSGDPRWWQLCEQAARHYRDVVVVHYGAPNNPNVGGPRHHNATSLWMAQHEEQYWIADHTMAGTSTGHSWAEGMIDYWFLTGDPWSEEVVRGLADWYSRNVEQNRFGAGGQERGPGWTLIAISALVNALNDERLRNAGWTVANWLIQWQDPIRGVVSVPISEQPSYEGGSTFMHGIVGRGLGRWYDVTGDPRVKEATIGIAEWITTEPMGEPGTFWYKQSPQNSKRYGADGQCLTALTYAYKLSGDPWFAEIATALLNRTGASIRSMSWYPQALHHLAERE